MRPKKLADEKVDLALITAFNEVKKGMKAVKVCNQYKIAGRLKTHFCPSSPHGMLYEKYEAECINPLIDRFGVSRKAAIVLLNYLDTSTPAAIVQMIKRAKKRIQVHNS